MSKPVKNDKKQAKLTYNDQRELDALPARIEALEEEKLAIEERFCEADYFTRDPEAFQKDQQRIAELEDELSTAYARWEELESSLI